MMWWNNTIFNNFSQSGFQNQLPIILIYNLQSTIPIKTNYNTTWNYLKLMNANWNIYYGGNIKIWKAY